MFGFRTSTARGGDTARCRSAVVFRLRLRLVTSRVRRSALPFFFASVLQPLARVCSSALDFFCFSRAPRTCHKTEPLRRGIRAKWRLHQRVFAVDEKVLVGDNQHQAYVARPVREGDDTVLVRWESTKKEEEVAVGDVKKIDLEAKRPRRKRRDASAAETEASAPAQREPPRKRRKKKALPSAHESRAARLKTLQSGGSRRQEVGCRSAGIARQKRRQPRRDRSAARGLLSGGSLYGRSAAAAALAKLTGGWHQTAARTAAITEAGAIPPLVALVRNVAADGQAEAARTLGQLADNNAANQAAVVKAGGIEALVALVRSGDADSGGRRGARWNLSPTKTTPSSPTAPRSLSGSWGSSRAARPRTRSRPRPTPMSPTRIQRRRHESRDRRGGGGSRRSLAPRRTARPAASRRPRGVEDPCPQQRRQPHRHCSGTSGARGEWHGRRQKRAAQVLATLAPRRRRPAARGARDERCGRRPGGGRGRATTSQSVAAR